jgi:hypothetical protein
MFSIWIPVSTVQYSRCVTLQNCAAKIFLLRAKFHLLNCSAQKLKITNFVKVYIPLYKHC